MIGVAAIIVVMSVMNGFREELTSRLLGINGHINIYNQSGNISKKDAESIKKNNLENINVFPLVETQALLINKNLSQGIYLKGYENKDINENHFLFSNIVAGNIFNQNSSEIIIGYALANKLNLNVGDKVRIAIPKTDKTIFGNIPRFKTLKISGIFNLGMYEYDYNFVFMDPVLPRKLLMIKDHSYNKIEIFTNNPNNIEIIQENLNNKLTNINSKLVSYSWKENNSSLISALKVEKNVMFLILTLIIIVASMNIISGLIIFVKEKNKDIGILKTLGLTNLSLVKIFITIGLIIGIIGTTLGTTLGIIFCLNISSIQIFIENFLNVNLFQKEIYYLSSLPARLDQKEVLYVVLISIIISFISTIFPAYRSSIIDPIKSLKND